MVFELEKTGSSTLITAIALIAAMFAITALSAAMFAANAVAESAIAATSDSKLRDGQTREAEHTDLQAWSAQRGRWVSADQFWQDYASQHGGLKWGRRNSYPPYHEVNERDLMIIVLPTGSCLMEFWHGRWRRAQDVRRWSEAFNKVGGCPRVFD